MACLIAATVLFPPAGWTGTPGARPDGALEAPAADAEALIKGGHWKRALAILDPLVKAHPDDARGNYLLAEVRMAFSDFQEALALAQHAVELDGKSSDYHLILGQVFGELASTAKFLSAGSLAVKFRKEVETALDLNPNNIQALDSMMLFKYQAPGFLGGSKDEAQSLANRITALNPSEGYLAHAELAEQGKKPGEMETDFVKAVQANPKDYGALTALASFYSQSPHLNLDAAAKYAQAALKVNATRIGAYKVLARVDALQQRWSELDQTLAAAEKDVPDDLAPDYEAAQALLDTGADLTRAERYARKYLTQEPEGEEPDAAEAHRLLGLILEKEGRTNEARSEMQTAVHLKPGFKAAQNDLKRLTNWF